MSKGRPSSVSRSSISASRRPAARRSRQPLIVKLLGAITAVSTAVAAFFTTRSSPPPAPLPLAAEVFAGSAGSDSITPSAGGPPITDAAQLCERYLRIYCEIDDAEPRQLTFPELLPDQQHLVRQRCERAATAAAPHQLQAMAACLDCINDCSDALRCLEGDQPCRDNHSLYQ